MISYFKLLYGRAASGSETGAAQQTLTGNVRFGSKAVIS
jgi:hypothetical protein